MNIGRAIRELRKQKGLSQKQLSSKAKMTQAALSQIENGKRPGIDTLKKISQALSIPESLIYVQSIEKEDVAENKQGLYDQLFPIIQAMVGQIARQE
jgi:XRE family transcriptional regulator, regulator of sulfur utilization